MDDSKDSMDEPSSIGDSMTRETIQNAHHRDRHPDYRYSNGLYSPIDSSLPAPYLNQNYVISHLHTRANSTGTSGLVRTGTASTSSTVLPTAPPLMAPSSSAADTSSSTQGSIQAKSTVSSEYTPLLEDFTKKFMESHMANSTPNQPMVANPSTQLLTPPELLLIFQQQAPFNPNLVSSASTSSSRSSSFNESSPLYPTVPLISGSDHQNDHRSSPHLQQSRHSSELMSSRLSSQNRTSSGSWHKFCRFLWYFTNLVLLVSLMTFNFGMLVTPEIYLAFVSVFRTLTTGDSGGGDDNGSTSTIATNDGHELRISATYITDKFQNNSYLIDLTIVIVIQIVLSILSTLSGLILLYGTCRIVGTIRKRYNNSFLKNSVRNHFYRTTPNGTNNTNISSWFVISYELIVAETLGTFCARLLSLIMTGYFFAISIIYMLLLRDFFDMFFASIQLPTSTTDDSHQQMSLFCENRWYLNNDVVSAIWLTLFIVLIIGINSLHSVTRRSLQKMFSLSWIKKLSTLIGFFFVVFITFFVAYLFGTGGQIHESSSKSGTSYREQTINAQHPARLLCLNSDSSFNWKCLEKNWLLLIASVPLLLMPFNMNDLLVTLLFTNYNFQKKSRTSSPNIRNVLSGSPNPPTSSSSFSNPNVISDQDLLHDNHRAIINRSSSNHSRSFPVVESGSTSIYYHHHHHHQPPAPQQFPISGVAPSTFATLDYETIPSRPSSFPVSMESKLVADDSFFKPSSFKQLRNLFIAASVLVLLLNIMVNLFVYISYMREPSTNPYGEDPVVSLDLNFLRKYFQINSGGSAGHQSTTSQYLLIAASSLLLLKTTFLYLLFVFSGLMSGQYFLTKSKDDQLLRPGLCLNGLLFTSPFILWNFLVLLTTIFLEFFPDYLHLAILVYGWLGLFVVFVFPSFMLIYISVKSMSKSPRISARSPTANSSSVSSTIPYTSLGTIRFRPIPWPKLSFLFGFLLMSIGVFYLIFWLFSYVNNNPGQANPRVISFVPYIHHLNSSSIYCHQN